mgnify:CR=1
MAFNLFIGLVHIVWLLDKDARYYAGSKPHNQATIINTNIIFSSFNPSGTRLWEEIYEVILLEITPTDEYQKSL